LRGEIFQMEFKPESSLLVQTALSMSRVPDAALSPEGVELARVVRLVLDGDSAAFEQIIQRYETRVMTMAARLLGSRDEARDAAQEVFLRAFRYLHRLDLQKPLEPWLIRITVNVCRDIGRKRQYRLNSLVQTDPPEAMDESKDPYAELAEQQEIRMLQIALNSLPEKERMAILLRDVEGLSTGEVAAILQSSETTVRSQVSRGRVRIKEAIDRMRGGAR
jgi:RNA polymerase sigma-70 factor (ECF subfamily)